MPMAIIVRVVMLTKKGSADQTIESFSFLAASMFSINVFRAERITAHSKSWTPCANK